MVDEDQQEPQEIPPAVLRAFGSSKARPRVVKAWIPTWGFRKVKPSLLLTTAAARRLRAQGGREIELVWRRWHQRMTLMPGFRSVWGSPPPQATVEQREPDA